MESRGKINKKDNIKLFHLNVQSIKNKIDELELTLNDKKIDIACVTEHWLQSSDPKSLVIEGYEVLSYFSRNLHEHGGSLILVKQCLANMFKSYAPVSSAAIEAHCEICGVTFKDVCIICCYRPGTGNVDVFLDLLFSVFSNVLGRYSKLIFCGDLNIDYLTESNNKQKLCDLFDSFGLTITTKEPTRICTNRNGATSISIIDYVVTNIESVMYSCKIFNPHTSDHLAHLMEFSLTSCDNATREDSYTKQQSGRHLSPTNIQAFTSLIQRQNWDKLLNNYEGTDRVWWEFLDNIKYCLDCSCPLKSQVLRNTKTKNWYNSQLAELKLELDKLFWLQKNIGSAETSQNYKIRKKEYKNKIRNAKKEYYKNKIDNSGNKSKMIWKIVNTQLNKQNLNNHPIELTINNKLITEPNDIAKEFVDYFSSVSEKKIKDKYGSISTICSESPMLRNSIMVTNTDEFEIRNIICRLQNKNSAGADGINSKLLKSISHLICHPLSDLINLSLLEGVFPNVLKTANVTPIYKKNDRNSIENYRQISLVSVFSKVLEKVVYRRIIDFVSKYGIVENCQHGFLPGKSTETASFNLLNFICQNLDQGKFVVALFFDLSIAFDTVNKSFLLTKLYNMGIRGTLLNWINSYMTDRKIIVKYGDIFSDNKPISLGVPQGSVLGPLLFILYVNDASAHLGGNHLTMYADDLTVVVASENLMELRTNIIKVQGDFEEWCKTNNLILNNDKTVIVNAHIRKPVPDNFFIKNNIKTSNAVKFLGTYLDSTCSFDVHIEHVCAKLNSAYFATLKLKSTLSEAGLLTVYYSLVYSFASYNVIVWGWSRLCKRVFIAQKRILRLIFNMGYRESCRSIFVEKKILTFPCIYMYKCLKFFNENRHLFTNLNSNNGTRMKDLYVIPRHRTSFFERSPMYNCIKLYNGLAPNLRTLRGIKFDNAVKKIPY